MPNQLTGRVIRRRHFVAFLTLCLALLVSPAFAQAPARVIAVGDVHGDYDAFVSILQQAGLIDAKLHWAGKNATLVQTGDILDRGAKCREVMDLLMALEEEAPRTGGRVITLLGNHEAMNIMGDLRYAERMYAGFADDSSDKRRKAAYDSQVAWQKARSAAGKLAAAEPSPEAEAAWMKAHPPGYVEQREAMSASGKYGRWLRERPAVVQISSTLFVHGGISPELATWKPEAIAARVRSEVKAFDDFTQLFQQQKIILKSFDLTEITEAVHAELEFRNAELARKMGEAAQKSKGNKPAEASEAEKKQIQKLSNFLGYNNWFSVHPAGPLWYRGYAHGSEEEGAAQVAKVLAGMGVSQIVVGHTSQTGGRIAARFDGKVFLIDTGMLSSFYVGGRASALEIAAGKFTAIYRDQSVVLVDPARTIAPSVPASREVQNSSELPGGGLNEQQQTQPQQQQAPAPAAQAEAPVAAPAAIVWLDPDGNPLPFKTKEEVLEFLRTADVVKMKNIPTGVAAPRKVLLEKGGIRANAKFSDIREEIGRQEFASGQIVRNFRDDAIFDLAAQELGWMLGMDNLPPVVQRTVKGNKGILQIWVENVMTEMDRQKSKTEPPDVRRWNRQIHTMQVFDNLVANTDRNTGNILIDKNWKVWLIDHTRAFPSDFVVDAKQLIELDRGVWQKLLALDEGMVQERLKPYLRKNQIDALLKRRKKIIEHFQAEIAKRGESEVIRD